MRSKSLNFKEISRKKEMFEMGRIVPAVFNTPSSTGGRSLGAAPVNTTGLTPLDSITQHRMEVAFGADFSEVTVHSNSPLPNMFAAMAYTQGTEIHFAPGRYQPHDDAGFNLLSHELTHVVQQRQGYVTVQIPEGMVELTDTELASEPESIVESAANG
jgi:hypothetical protein